MNHTFCKNVALLHHDMIEPRLLSTSAKASVSSELVLLLDFHAFPWALEPPWSHVAMYVTAELQPVLVQIHPFSLNCNPARKHSCLFYFYLFRFDNKIDKFIFDNLLIKSF